jgi:hypothetical protein
VNYPIGYEIPGGSTVPDPETPSEPDHTIEGTITTNMYDVVTVTNTLKTGILVVSNEVKGNETDEEFEYTITLTGDHISGIQVFEISYG